MYQPAGTYYFELLFIPNTGQAAPTFSEATFDAWTDSTLSGTNAGNGIPTGLFLGHIMGENNAIGIAVSGWASSTSAYFVVLGWSADEGTWPNVEDALNGGSWLSPTGLFGYSMVGDALAGARPAPATILFGSYTGVIDTGWDLNPVPEPSTLALAGLGGLSLLLMRRLKHKD
jgi:hypothetical protein